MNNRKIILGIFIGVFIISIVIVGTLYLREGYSLPEISDDYQVTIYELTLEEMGLTEEQYQLLRDSIRSASLEQMNAIERRNAWLMLDAMAEIEFVENRSPGESGVGLATRYLELLGVGEIKELAVVDIWQQNIDDLAAVLVMRIVNSEDRTYYLRYNQTWGLGIVTRDSEDGEIIFDSFIHSIRDGRLCEREYPQGSVISREE